VYGGYRKKWELSFSPVMSWISPKVSACHQKTLSVKTGGRHLQGTGMNYRDMPIGLKPEQQNNFVCTAFCVLRTEFIEKQLPSSQALGGIYACRVPSHQCSLSSLATGIN